MSTFIALYFTIRKPTLGKWLFSFVFSFLAQSVVLANEVIYRINSGGGDLQTTTGLFTADNYFLPDPGYISTSSNAIANTTNADFYQKQRGATTNNGTFRYNLPVENGAYQVTLHLAETYWTRAGQRVFDVTAEDTKVLDNFDIFKKTGANTATTETFTINVADGTLSLYFSALVSDGGVNRPQIAGLEVVKVTNSSNQPPVFSTKTLAYTLSETTKVGTALGTLQATDPDAADALAYTLTAGNTNQTFTLNATTGELTLTKPLNHHAQSKFTLKARVTDRAGGFDEAIITIQVNPAPLVPAFTNLTWSTKTNQPYVVNEAQGKSVNNKLYTFGGFDSQKSGFTPTSRAYVFDPAANTWTAMAPMPPMNNTKYGGATHTAMATDGTDIYFAGGYTSSSDGKGQIFGTKEVYKYLVAENRYVRLPDLPIIVAAGQMEYVNGRLHHIGGTNKARTIDLSDHYVLDLDNLDAGWQKLAPLPEPRQHAGSAVFKEKIYYIGGQTGHDAKLIAKKAVHVYDYSTNTWTKKADLPVPDGRTGRGHISSSVVVLGDRIFVLGGQVVHGNSGHTNLVSAYTPATDTWQNVSALPQGRYSGVAGVLNGLLYYTGGSRTSTTFQGTPEISTGPVTAIPQPENNPENRQILVFPNPIVKDKPFSMEVRGFSQNEKVTVTLYSLLGQTMYTTTVLTNQSGKALVKLPNATKLQAGTYVLKARALSGEVQTKLVQH
ncbi:T9SS type A sorting domain-containing protein [Adhaeribacter swui]|uniref:T9SS type A sorting domain-containing protein n=1 Tax=Adhaeribacter swui TaxID=2086471 RepID=A0A7G7GCF0_9BACT|nr:malectin domain-containing carbohydrate-binding protein [Adhaeribacter swui]QNF34834.1 T9SS type A sorting domain-containing protein [Adhaeribacter swui]